MPTVVIASPKGGAGKSTAAIILGTELAHAGADVVMLDDDIAHWPQIEALDGTESLVTITIGGNDSRLFTTLVGECTRLARTDPDGAP